MIILLLFSFLAGIATILSPCIIPILPGVLSGGMSGGRRRPLGVVLGLVLSFSFFTLALTYLVRLTGISPNFLRYLAIASIFGFGVTMIFSALSNAFASLTSFAAEAGSRLQNVSGSESGFTGGFILGIALGLLWTPCAGPILASVTTLAITGSVNFEAVLLTLAYAVGASIPLFLIAAGGSRALASSRFLSSRAETIRKVFGVIMIATAIAMLFNIDRIIAANTLPSFLPDTAAIVQAELNKLSGQNSQALQGQPVDKLTLPEQMGSVLPDLGPAPEFAGVSSWINSDPLTMASLRGKVVLVDFWTYSCINCIRTFPYLTSWYSKYKDQGLVIVGVHSPEFEFEKDRNNVIDATKRFGLLYPVVQDNQLATWTAFGNHYWPADYLIDKNGHIRDEHFGEGNYVETENTIRSLLGLTPQVAAEPAQPSRPQTPEIYLGYQRAQNYTGSLSAVKPDSAATYTYTPPLAQDEVGLTGSWIIAGENIVSQSDTSKISLNFTAGKVHMVMGGKSQKPLTVTMDGQPVGTVNQSSDYTNGRLVINQDREYTVIDLHGGYGTHVLTVTIPTGIKLYTFTFSQ